MPALELIKIGNATGAIIPEELLARLDAGQGDTLYLTETKDGYLLSSRDPEAAEQIEAGREFMRRYHETFEALAK